MCIRDSSLISASETVSASNTVISSTDTFTNASFTTLYSISASQTLVNKYLRVAVNTVDYLGGTSKIFSDGVKILNEDDDSIGTVDIIGIVKQSSQVNASYTINDLDEGIKDYTLEWQVSDNASFTNFTISLISASETVSASNTTISSTDTFTNASFSTMYSISDSQTVVNKYLRVAVNTVDYLGGKSKIFSDGIQILNEEDDSIGCLLYTSPSPRDS